MPIFELPDEPLFPDPRQAEADGLLAIGGDLSAERLVASYFHGIFPWFNEDSEHIMWWSPTPRLVLYPSKFKLSKSLRQKIRRKTFEIRLDTAFEEVIRACGNAPRDEQDGTWITEKMITAYINLHELGLAHSVECWQDDKLVGGLYGISLGRSFFGESMFHAVSDASKVAFYSLSQLALKLDFHFIDCQMKTDHLVSLGAEEISRDSFLTQLAESNKDKTLQNSWQKYTPLLQEV